MSYSDGVEKFIQVASLQSETSEINRQRAKGNIYTTVLGQKSIAIKRDEMTKERAARGEEAPTRTDTWIESRLQKNKKNPSAPGEPINPQTKDVIDKLLEVSRRPDFERDPLTAVLGPEHPGRVRAMGLGVTPSSMDIYVQSEKNLKQLRKENKELRERWERVEVEVRERNLEMQEMKAQMHSFTTHMNGQGSLGIHIQAEDTSTARLKNLSCDFVVPPGVHKELHGRLVNLLVPRLSDRFVVAEAMLLQTDPMKSCHNKKIGEWCCTVNVLAVHQENLDLPYPNGDAEKLGEARLTIIKWPRQYIEIVPITS